MHTHGSNQTDSMMKESQGAAHHNQPPNGHDRLGGTRSPENHIFGNPAGRPVLFVKLPKVDLSRSHRPTAGSASRLAIRPTTGDNQTDDRRCRVNAQTDDKDLRLIYSARRFFKK